MESVRLKRVKVRFMDIYVTPKSFNIWAYMLVVKRADLHQTGSRGDHVIC